MSIHHQAFLPEIFTPLGIHYFARFWFSFLGTHWLKVYEKRKPIPLSFTSMVSSVLFSLVIPHLYGLGQSLGVSVCAPAQSLNRAAVHIW